MTSLLDNPRLTVPLNDGDHMLGSETASLSLVEYGDYECPYCGAAQSEVHRVLDRLGDQVLFAFRHFPLTQIHPHAAGAAEAAEAAGAQGRFWQMHELLFANQRRLDPAALLEYGDALALDVDRFGHELASHAHAAKVRADFMSGVRSGVNGTPTFFVNGIRHNGGWDAPTLLAALV